MPLVAQPPPHLQPIDNGALRHIGILPVVEATFQNSVITVPRLPEFIKTHGPDVIPKFLRERSIDLDDAGQATGVGGHDPFPNDRIKHFILFAQRLDRLPDGVVARLRQYLFLDGVAGGFMDQQRKQYIATGFVTGPGFPECAPDGLHDIHATLPGVDEGDQIDFRHINALGQASGVGDQAKGGGSEPGQCGIPLAGRLMPADVESGEVGRKVPDVRINHRCGMLDRVVEGDRLAKAVVRHGVADGHRVNAHVELVAVVRFVQATHFEVVSDGLIRDDADQHLVVRDDAAVDGLADGQAVGYLAIDGFIVHREDDPRLLVLVSVAVVRALGCCCHEYPSPDRRVPVIERGIETRAFASRSVGFVVNAQIKDKAIGESVSNHIG